MDSTKEHNSNVISEENLLLHWKFLLDEKKIAVADLIGSVSYLVIASHPKGEETLMNLYSSPMPSTLMLAKLGLVLRVCAEQYGQSFLVALSQLINDMSKHGK